MKIGAFFMFFSITKDYIILHYAEEISERAELPAGGRIIPIWIILSALN